MSITLTEKAAKHVRGFLSKEENAKGLRVAIRPTGCSGFSYVVETAKAVNEDDHVFESHDITIIVDKNSIDYLDGTEMDFQREGLNEGFKFNNPNVAETCGCGESFTVQ
jgi:iron-sulfur cluster assembly protein